MRKDTPKAVEVLSQNNGKMVSDTIVFGKQRRHVPARSDDCSSGTEWNIVRRKLIVENLPNIEVTNADDVFPTKPEELIHTAGLHFSYYAECGQYLSLQR
jgi:hypothetical protein